MEIKYSNSKITSWSNDQLWHIRKILCGYLCFGQQHRLLKFGLVFLFSTFISNVHSQEKNLDYFVKAALQNSPLLKDYNNLVLMNAIDSAKIMAGYKPQVNGKSINLYAPVVNG